MPIAARTGRGVDLLRDLLLERMPEGPPYYSDGELTDQPLEVRLSEIVREKALAVTRQEVPHSIAVVIEELDRQDGLTTIHASLIVERDSQKGIVIGKGGATLKTIGSRARARRWSSSSAPRSSSTCGSRCSRNGSATRRRCSASASDPTARS